MSLVMGQRPTNVTILNAYARVWSDNLDDALPLLQRLAGERPHLRLPFHAIELAAIGDFLVIAGPAEERAKYAHASATVVVDDLDAVHAILTDADATITAPPTPSPTGGFLYAGHADGVEVEYVQWTTDLVGHILEQGTPADLAASNRHQPAIGGSID
ncbi:hypothetical protein [Kutzneria buriramensis]|uniref:VOC domain-containing protein n=1 Tax=Kutzneria buriramensis TaxID=1045776 RepID=A0A3E0HKK7_9PSEU|nr:hypothetical protein [Kutzneria buriramensis]REH46947.1 hypothetical protein BCF44_106111 [Kutzneria buriramensis]